MNRNNRSNAFALPMVLIFTAAMTILVVGLFMSLTRERGASNTMAENDRAKLVAQSAIEHAAALLEKIPQPIPPGKPFKSGESGYQTPVNWITSPGLLTLVEGNRVTEIPLSTNPSASYSPKSTDADLNRPLLEPDADGKAIYPILPEYNGSAVPLRIAWINLLADPTQAASKDNPVVARYAFWIDDESTKLNINLAQGKPRNIDLDKPNPLMQEPLQGFTGSISSDKAANIIPVSARYASGGSNTTTLDVAYPLWHPSSLNLDVLDLPSAKLRKNVNDDPGSVKGNVATKVHNAIYIGGSGSTAKNEFRWRPFNAPNEIGSFVGDPDNPKDATRALFLRENLFHLTTTGRSPEFNVFGKSRLFWERQMPILDNSLYYQLDYDKDGPAYTHAGEVSAGRTDPGLPNEGKWYPNANGISHAAWSIAGLLARRDWPGMPPRSFVDKWGGDDTAKREADQVAWNMTIMGAYSPGSERTNSAGNLVEGNQATSAMLLNRATYSVCKNSGIEQYGVADKKRLPGANGVGIDTPNSRLFRGILSNKAILPWYPAPQVNEIALCAQLASSSDPTKVVVRMWFEVDVHFGGPFGTNASRKMPPTKGASNARWHYTFRFTDFEYSISQQNGPSATHAYPYNQTPRIGDASGLDRLKGRLITGDSLQSGEYYRIQGGKTYALKPDASLPANSVGKLSDGAASPSTSVALFNKQDTIKIDCRFRMYLGNRFDGVPDTVVQVMPVWDSLEQASSGSPYFIPPSGESDRLQITMEIDPALLLNAASQPDPTKIYIRSLEISDSRLGINSSPWRPYLMIPDGESIAQHPPADVLDGHNLGGPNWSELYPDTFASSAADLPTFAPQSTTEASKIAYFDFLNKAYGTVYPRGTIGMLSTIPTGMQRGLPYKTLRFQPSVTGAELPDWLVLDMFAPAIQPFAYMHSVMGKINPNAKITPDVPSERWKPLQALVENMNYSGASGSPSSVVNKVLNYQFSGHDFGAKNKYDYIGELCEVSGFASSGGDDWHQEALIRNLANLLTTKSNSFTVYGVAQVVRKNPASKNYDEVEPADQITGEKRFKANLERSVWPGVDGMLGNATTDANGNYTKTAEPRGFPDYDKSQSSDPGAITDAGRWIGDVPWAPLPTPVYGDKANYPIPGASWPVIDGPDAPTYKPISIWPGSTPEVGSLWGEVRYEDTPLEEAANPLRAWMRVNVLNFDFLDQ